MIIDAVNLKNLNQDKNKNVLNSYAGAFYSFKKGSSLQVYPSSLMGCIALLRQLHYDLDWYSYQNKDDYEDLSMKAMQQHEKTPQFFIANNHLNVLRASKIAKDKK